MERFVIIVFMKCLSDVMGCSGKFANVLPCWWTNKVLYIVWNSSCMIDIVAEYCTIVISALIDQRIPFMTENTERKYLKNKQIC